MKDGKAVSEARLADGIDLAGRVVARTGYHDPRLLRRAADLIEQVASNPIEHGYARGLRIIAASLEDGALGSTHARNGA